MRIDSSTVGMESARNYFSARTTYRRFSITDYRAGSFAFTGNALNAAVTGGQSGNGQVQEDRENGGSEAPEKKLYTLEDWQNSLSARSVHRSVNRYGRSNFMDDLRSVTLRYFFDLLFADRRSRTNQWMNEQSVSANAAAGADQNANLQIVDFGTTRVMTYAQETYSFEQEDTMFSTQGTVRTSDGREINFNVDIGMSRQFQETFQEDLAAMSYNMCDPLVINLDTDVAELSDQKFYFDIDADGELDEISQLGAKSGYLALDKNGDGAINDGSELFGAASGDGFADLAQYDEDGNGWIDENDAIWSKLKIWCRDENGNDVLYRLADKGVGAICLAKAATDFTLKGSDGQTNGAIRSTGVFLYENGNVGTVQHVDVAKYEQGA